MADYSKRSGRRAELIERCEDRLRAIDDAFSRLKSGRYGICEKCRQEIPIKRLKAVPFAAYCIDRQKKRNERNRPGEGDIDEPSRKVSTPPEEMNEAADKLHSARTEGGCDDSDLPEGAVPD